MGSSNRMLLKLLDRRRALWSAAAGFAASILRVVASERSLQLLIGLCALHGAAGGLANGCSLSATTISRLADLP
jgi:hypothetical protein